MTSPLAALVRNARGESPKDGVEVHLPMYRPTAKATTSLFGTD
ncbi:DUF4842 domain-containing protein, partial [Bacteroides sp. 51]